MSKYEILELLNGIKILIMLGVLVVAVPMALLISALWIASKLW